MGQLYNNIGSMPQFAGSSKTNLFISDRIVRTDQRRCLSEKFGLRIIKGVAQKCFDDRDIIPRAVNTPKSLKCEPFSSYQLITDDNKALCARHIKPYIL